MANYKTLVNKLIDQAIEKENEKKYDMNVIDRWQDKEFPSVVVNAAVRLLDDLSDEEFEYLIDGHDTTHVDIYINTLTKHRAIGAVSTFLNKIVSASKEFNSQLNKKFPAPLEVLTESNHDKICDELCDNVIDNLEYCNIEISYEQECIENTQKNPYVVMTLRFKRSE